jgi:hypothetical protein
VIWNNPAETFSFSLWIKENITCFKKVGPAGPKAYRKIDGDKDIKNR